MAIAPPTTTYTCPACHWSKTVASRGDALMPGEHFSACPACGKAPLESRPAHAARAALAQLAQQVRRALR